MYRNRRIYFTFTLLVLIFPALAQQAKTSLEKDKEMLLTILKISLAQQYFDNEKASILVDKLAEMEIQRKFDGASVAEVAQTVTDFLRKETNDKHFNISAAPIQPVHSQIQKRITYSAAGISDYHIEKNNIGYIKWNLCIANENAFKEFRKVLDTLANCSSLIFDLSENPGGDGSSSAFINQFIYQDKSYQTLLRKKCTREKNWHQSEVVFNYIDGPKLFDKPIYIISSKNTFSAAEYFVLTAKEMKRAIILGETTAGAGNPGTSQGYHSPNSDTVFWLFIPNCQIITRSGNSIEGVGVKPDVVLKSNDWLKETLEYIANNKKH